MWTLGEMAADKADNAAHVLDVFGLGRSLDAEQLQSAPTGFTTNGFAVSRILADGFGIVCLQPSLQFARCQIHQGAEGLLHLGVRSLCHGLKFTWARHLVQEATGRFRRPQPIGRLVDERQEHNIGLTVEELQARSTRRQSLPAMTPEVATMTTHKTAHDPTNQTPSVVHCA